MNKKAKLILVEIEALKDCEDLKTNLIILNEIIKDAKELAESILEEEEAA